MTHLRLNIGTHTLSAQRRRPIAHKYRKGTMKSTLHSTTVLYSTHSSKGSEIESEIASQPTIESSDIKLQSNRAPIGIHTLSLLCANLKHTVASFLSRESVQHVCAYDLLYSRSLKGSVS